jgi:soluble lytic murein transglycosylase-like protein
MVCAVTPAFAHGHRSHHSRKATATAAHPPSKAAAATVAHPHSLLDLMAAGAAMKPGDIVPATGSAIRLQPGQQKTAEARHEPHTAAHHHKARASRHETARRHHRDAEPAPARQTAEREKPVPKPAPKPAGHSIPAVSSDVVASGPHSHLRQLVARYAKKEGIPFALAHGVVMVESRYRPHATGHGGYIGLMQLSYRTARGMGYRGSRAGLYNPETNIRYGVQYLAKAYRMSGGNLCATVSKYQGGTGVSGVTRAGAQYCGRVRRYMAQLKHNDVELASANQ